MASEKSRMAVKEHIAKADPKLRTYILELEGELLRAKIELTNLRLMNGRTGQADKTEGKKAKRG